MRRWSSTSGEQPLISACVRSLICDGLVAKQFPMIHPANTSHVSFTQAFARGVTPRVLPSIVRFPLAAPPMSKHGVMQQGARQWRTAKSIDVFHHPFGEPPPQLCHGLVPIPVLDCHDHLDAVTPRTARHGSKNRRMGPRWEPRRLRPIHVQRRSCHKGLCIVDRGPRCTTVVGHTRTHPNLDGAPSKYRIR
jgi:hypothetical protein